jgi:Tfp pilus assembly PilM family ATPase
MSILSVLRESASPPAAVELAAGRVSAAALEWRGDQAVVAAHASEVLPAGALAPSLTAANLHDRPAVLAALGRVLERIGKPRRIGLVVPDTVGRISLVRFAQVPPKAQDLDQLVRWQVRKTAPFAIEEAQVSYAAGLQAEDGQEFLVTLARRDVVQEYEQLCAEAGAHAGLVDLTTINVVNAVLAGSAAPSADWLLVNIAAGYTSVALLRGPHLIFFRNRSADTDGTLVDLVHQTAMYYEDRLSGAGFSHVFLAGAGEQLAGGSQQASVDELRRSLEARLQTSIELVDPRAAAPLTDRITAAPALLDALTPLVGMMLRDRDKVPA